MAKKVRWAVLNTIQKPKPGQYSIHEFPDESGDSDYDLCILTCKQHIHINTRTGELTNTFKGELIK